MTHSLSQTFYSCNFPAVHRKQRTEALQIKSAPVCRAIKFTNRVYSNTCLLFGHRVWTSDSHYTASASSFSTHHLGALELWLCSQPLVECQQRTGSLHHHGLSIQVERDCINWSRTSSTMRHAAFTRASLPTKLRACSVDYHVINFYTWREY